MNEEQKPRTIVAHPAMVAVSPGDRIRLADEWHGFDGEEFGIYKRREGWFWVLERDDGGESWIDGHRGVKVEKVIEPEPGKGMGL